MKEMIEAAYENGYTSACHGQSGVSEVVSGKWIKARNRAWLEGQQDAIREGNFNAWRKPVSISF